jgi:MFS family permease
MASSMTGIAIVLLVSTVTGSYGIAGAASAAYAVCNAAAKPVIGRLSDRHGQGRVLRPLVLGNAASVAALGVLAWFSGNGWTLSAAAAAAGLTTPSLGALVRARWSYLLSPQKLSVAYAFESAVDEFIFIIGPVIIALVTSVHPAAGIAIAGVLMLTGGLTFAAQRHTEPPRRAAAGRGSAIGARGMGVLLLVFAAIGAATGALDVSMIAFAQQHGHRALGGVTISVGAIGSLFAGLWYGARTWRSGLDRRFLAGLTFFAVGFIPLYFINSLWLMLPMCFVLGLASTPTYIPGYGLVEQLVPDRMLTEGLTWMNTSPLVGSAVGTPMAGRLIDAYGTQTALLLSAGVMWFAVAMTAAGARRLRHRGAPSREAAPSLPGDGKTAHPPTPPTPGAGGCPSRLAWPHPAVSVPLTI